jgi:hypothetical protein
MTGCRGVVLFVGYRWGVVRLICVAENMQQWRRGCIGVGETYSSAALCLMLAVNTSGVHYLAACQA